MRRLSFMLLLSVMEHFSYGQCLINGMVTDEKGNPLTGVNVLIKGTYDGAATNITGEFYFQSNEQGVQIMIVSYLGYKILEREVTLDGDLKDMQFILKEEINKIEGITISAGAFEASDKKKSVVLRTFDIVTTAGATADITGVMNTLPGTQTVGEAGRLFVRGGDGYETKTFINGLLVAVPYGQTPHNIPSRFRFNPFLFKGAFFSTGGYSAEYGQALSSVLQLDTYDLPAKSQTDVSTMSVGGDISQTIRKGNTSIYGQIQYTDLSGYFFLVPQKYAWDRAPNSYNSTLHFKQRFNETGTIQLYTNYDHSGMKVYQPLPGNVNEQGLFDISNDNFYSNFAVKNSLSEHLSYRGGLSFSANNSQVIMNGEISNESRIQANHSKIVFDHDVSENILLRYGGEWIYSDYTEIFIDQGENLVQEFNVRDHTVGSFAEADVYFSNKLMARVGARYEFNSSIDKQCVSPRTSLAYKLDKHSQFSMAFGRFTQLPTIDYMKWSTNLKPEKATHYILNYQYNNTGRIFRSEIYYKKYDQLVTKKCNSEQLVDLGNGGYGSAEGFELFWRDSKTFDHTDYWISYSYLDTKRKYDIFPYPVMPYYASAHNLSIVSKHFIASIKSQIGWTYSFASGRPYTDPNETEFNSKKTKSYNDLSLNYSYLVKANMIIHASITNVLGFENIFGYQYNSSPNEHGIYESTPIEPQAKRFLFLGFFITISKDKNANQLNNL